MKTWPRQVHSVPCFRIFRYYPLVVIRAWTRVDQRRYGLGRSRKTRKRRYFPSGRLRKIICGIVLWSQWCFHRIMIVKRKPGMWTSSGSAGLQVLRPCIALLLLTWAVRATALHVRVLRGVFFCRHQENVKMLTSHAYLYLLTVVLHFL